MVIVLNCTPASPMWIGGSVATYDEIARGGKAGWRKQARVKVDASRGSKGDGR